MRFKNRVGGGGANTRELKNTTKKHHCEISLLLVSTWRRPPEEEKGLPERRRSRSVPSVLVKPRLLAPSLIPCLLRTVNACLGFVLVICSGGGGGGGSTPGGRLQEAEFCLGAAPCRAVPCRAAGPSGAYTKTRLCLLSFRIFPSLCLAVAMPFLGRLPGEEGHALTTAVKNGARKGAGAKPLVA